MDSLSSWIPRLTVLAAVANAVFAALDRFGVVMITNAMILVLMVLLFLVMALVLERTQKVAILDRQWADFLAKKDAEIAARYDQHFNRMANKIETLVNQYVEKTTEQDTRISKLESEWGLFKRPQQPGS